MAGFVGFRIYANVIVVTPAFDAMSDIHRLLSVELTSHIFPSYGAGEVFG